MIVKLCKTCKEYFPAEPGEWICYCPTCYDAPRRLAVLNAIKRMRYIPVDWFDVFDTEYPGNASWKYKYEHVCRGCGKRLINKNGAYSPSKRYCHNPCSFSTTAGQYVVPKWAIIEKNKTSLGFICPQCKKRNKWDQFDVHHIVPVHTLTWENLSLLWDENNLIALCPKCHKQQDHQLVRKRPVEVKKILFNGKVTKQKTLF